MTVLVYHPESDSLFYADTFETDGLAEDVTGVPEYELMAKERGLVMPEDTRKAFMEQRGALTNKLRERLRQELAHVLADNIVTSSCITCVHFKEQQGELCSLYKARPPARIIAAGCPSYMDYDEVPF